MEKVKLISELREEKGKKVNKRRKQGMIPAVVYGNKIESRSLWINALDFERLLKKSGESVIIDLSIGNNDVRSVLINELQQDPRSGNYTHIDFYQVKMDEKIKTEVELIFIGESPAVKESGGVLVKNLDKIEIECLPADLPSFIEVNIADIKTFEERVYIKDLKLPMGVKVENDPKTVVALVVPPRSEEELSQLEEKVEEDVTKVEGVIKEVSTAEEEKDKKGMN
jgi:large subunit ribosomal protein L25